jgi:tRNA/tmRNA/rRNA uracil-C5-methylase (TrmA/RlmC/RlmD family)
MSEEELAALMAHIGCEQGDAALFVEKGYRVQKVQSVDMFCWTSGVENVMVLAKL